MCIGEMSSGWTGYVLAIGLTALSVLTRWGLPDVLEGAPYLAFYPTLVAAALFGGLGPGLLATVGTAMCIDLRFDDTPGWINIHDPVVLGQLAIFLPSGIGVSVIAGMRRATLLRERRQSEERARMAMELRKSETLLRAFIDGAPEPMFVRHRENYLLMANPATVAVFGKPVEAVLGRPGKEWFPDESLVRTIEEHDRQVMESGRTQVVEETIPTPEGPRTFLAAKSPYRDADGQIVGIVGMAHDITDRKQAEQEREAMVQFLRLVNEVKGTSELTRAATAFFQRLSGCEAVGIRLRRGDDYPYSETLGFPPQFVELENHLCKRDAAGNMVRDGNGRPAVECMCGNVIRGRFDPSRPFFTPHGSFWTNSTTELLAGTTEADRLGPLRNCCNTEGYESVALLPLPVGGDRLGLLQLNDRGKGRFSPQSIALWERLTGYLAVALARSLAEEERERVLADLARSNAELEQFASLIAHDLLSPVVTASTYASILARDDGNQLSPESQEALKLVQAGTARMNELVRRLLDYSRLGKSELNARPCDLNAMVETVLKGLESSLAQTGAQVTHHVLPTVKGDPTLLSQVFQNLLENALKYRGAEAPRVHVAARETDREWVFSVSDNGMGIDPRHFDRLFQIFQRLHRDESHYPGLGVGLAMCKRIIEKHGGRIWVESQPGQGSTFAFALPK